MRVQESKPKPSMSAATLAALPATTPLAGTAPVATTVPGRDDAVGAFGAGAEACIGPVSARSSVEPASSNGSLSAKRASLVRVMLTAATQGLALAATC